ncbi:MAG TPA: hypothetical protein VNU66_12900, partial [Mycobacteriales bacterium]|nr:hypothetical protein [Mycobacteriales bacterium]
MTAVHHVPGDGTALVGPRAVLLLDGVPEVEGLWPLVRDGADLDALLAALLEQGLRALGSFALLHDDRLVLRGTATAEDAAGEALSAGGAATWAEHPVPGEVALALQGDAARAPLLPLVAGVVRAARVAVGTAGTVPPAVEDRAPVPVAVPDPAPPAPVPAQPVTAG